MQSEIEKKVDILNKKLVIDNKVHIQEVFRKLNESIDEDIKEIINQEYYPDVDPEIINRVYEIDWDINEEDIENFLYEDIDLEDVVSVRYLSDQELSNVSDDYEGGYCLTYKDGSTQKFVYGYYPDNDYLEPLEESIVKESPSDLLEYVKNALKNKQDENEDYSIAQYVLNNLKKDIEDNVKYWAKNRVDISKIKKDYEGCVVLFDKYGTCPDKQLIMRKITNKINELYSEYKKNFDSKLERFEKRNNMNRMVESMNKGLHRRLHESKDTNIIYKVMEKAVWTLINDGFTYDEIKRALDEAEYEAEDLLMKWKKDWEFLG